MRLKARAFLDCQSLMAVLDVELGAYVKVQVRHLACTYLPDGASRGDSMGTGDVDKAPPTYLEDTRNPG